MPARRKPSMLELSGSERRVLRFLNRAGGAATLLDIQMVRLLREEDAEAVPDLVAGGFARRLPFDIIALTRAGVMVADANCST